nr:RHS repeat-associated core domain-containing protein [Oxobacter pfennigii]
MIYDGWNFTWEEGRQLKSMVKSGTNISFKYNDRGIRTEKTVNGVITKYHLVGDKVTFEETGSDKIYFTYDSSSKLVSMNLNGVEYFYIRNAVGNITGLLDNAGTQVVFYSYDTWGGKVSVTGPLAGTVGVKNPYRYRGYRYDNETTLYYLQSRYYNPEWGRFINSDAAIGEAGGLLGHNLFVYCKNNPVNMSDPSGFRALYDDYSGAKSLSWADFKQMDNILNLEENINPQAPPPPETGYKPPKNPDKAKRRVPAPGAHGETGWLDKDNRVWVPDFDMDGGQGWRRHYPNGSHDHVYPNGKVRTHNMQIFPNLTPPLDPVALAAFLYVIYKTLTLPKQPLPVY